MKWFTTCEACGRSLEIDKPEAPAHHIDCPPPKVREVDHLAQEWLRAVQAGDSEREAVLQAEIELLESQPRRLREAALVYSQWGWKVFPLINSQKRPATRNGFKDASADATQIEAWWGDNQFYNVGLPTGDLFDVIDIDVPKGVPFWQQLLDTDLEAHGMVSTSSGGIHLFVKPTGQGNAAGRKPGVDHRGQGGYVVAPPSTLEPLEPRWRCWSWVMKPSPAIKGA